MHGMVCKELLTNLGTRCQTVEGSDFLFFADVAEVSVLNVGLVRLAENLWLLLSFVLLSMSSPLSLVTMKWYYYEFMNTWCIARIGFMLYVRYS